jgi:ATP-dependent DNA helicase RecG
VIQQVVPHYKIDALVRKIHMDRYDDREYIQTNLIDAYDRLLDFVAKHLPDVFFLEGDQRISLRTRIFREIVANLIVHREYTNALPATFCIYRDRVEVENANNPHGEGQLSLDTFTPYPKNPLISKFFMQLGRVEELGSGFLNVNKYLGYYTLQKKPQFIEGTRFRTIIPLDETLMADYGRVNGRVNEWITRGMDEKAIGGINDVLRQKLMEMAMIIHASPKQKKPDLARTMSISIRTATRYLRILQDLGIAHFEGVPKTGGYVLTSDFMRDIEK